MFRCLFRGRYPATDLDATILSTTDAMAIQCDSRKIERRVTGFPQLFSAAVGTQDS